MLHVPDVGVSPALYLLLGLSNGLAKAVVDLFMDAVPGLVPDQVGHTVDGGLQKLTGLPGVLLPLAALLPAAEAKRKHLLRHGQGPDIVRLGQLRRLSLRQYNQSRPPLSGPRGQTGGVLGTHTPKICQYHVRLGCQRLLGLITGQKAVGKAFQRRQGPNRVPEGLIPACQIKIQLTMIHVQRLPVFCMESVRNGSLRPPAGGTALCRHLFLILY